MRTVLQAALSQWPSPRVAAWLAPRSAAVVLLAAAACAAPAPVQDLAFCTSANWFSIGESDGNSGQRPERVRDYEQRCRASGVAIDPALYRAGYDRGQKQYCQVQRAYDLGRTGVPVRGDLCPEAVQDEYYANYERGLVLYCTRDNLFREGRGTGEYRGVCPRGAQRGLDDSYKEGRQLRDWETQLAERTAEVSDTERSLQFFKDRDKRAALDAKLKRLRKERAELQRLVDAALIRNGLKGPASP